MTTTTQPTTAQLSDTATPQVPRRHGLHPP